MYSTWLWTRHKGIPPLQRKVLRSRDVRFDKIEVVTGDNTGRHLVVDFSSDPELDTPNPSDESTVEQVPRD